MTKHLTANLIAAANFLSVLLLASLVAAQQPPAASPYDWLNGKWRGPAPGGGAIIVDIKVIDSNQITGSARMEIQSSYQPLVSGSVNGDKVTIILTNTRSGNNAHFDLTRSDGQLVGSRKGEAIVFQKMP